MKMSKELFAEIRDTINKNVMDKHSLQTIIDHRSNVKYAKSQFISFCWSIFYASKFDCRKLYNAGLHDNHIETALKQILSDFTN